MYLYLLRCNSFVKIGIAKNMKQRLKSYNTHNPCFEVLGSFYYDDFFTDTNAKNIERKYHIILKQHFNYKQDWIELCSEDINTLLEFMKQEHLDLKNPQKVKYDIHLLINKNASPFLTYKKVKIKKIIPVETNCPF